MGAEQLQGTPWHSEQMHKTCQDGSKHCLYILDNGICGFKPGVFYQKYCVGKGDCEDFESKSNSSLTNKKSKNKTIQTVYHPERTRANRQKKREEDKLMQPKSETKQQNNSNKTSEQNKLNNQNKKQEDFLRISQSRVNKIIEAIESLGNLSNKNKYYYTDAQVDKMFSYIEKTLEETKHNFKNKKSSGKFEW